MTVLRSWDNISSRKVIFRQKNTRTKAYKGRTYSGAVSKPVACLGTRDRFVADGCVGRSGGTGVRGEVKDLDSPSQRLH